MNRTVFFSRVRETLFNGRLGQAQVDNMNLLLNTHDEFFPEVAADQLAVVFATVFHETGATMRPIMEKGGTAYFTRMYDIKGSRPAKARELGNTTPGDGAKYPGMGYVQSTGKGNAIKATKVLSEAFGVVVDCVKNPQLLMVPKYAAYWLFYGMVHGLFTGKKLSSYVNNDGKEDPDEFKNSRRIINGIDRAELIAGHARKFLDAINRADKAKQFEAEIDPSFKMVDTGDVVTGKPLYKSKEVIGTVISSGVGLIGAGSEGLQHAQMAVDTAQQAKSVADSSWELITGIGPWAIVCLIIVIAAGVVIYERHKKSINLGI